MRKINFCVPIVDLENKEVTNGGKKVMINEVIANMLSGSKPRKSAIRQLNLALNIFNSKEAIDIEDEDVETIKRVVEEQSATVLVAGQLLKLLEK